MEWNSEYWEAFKSWMAGMNLQIIKTMILLYTYSIANHENNSLNLHEEDNPLVLRKQPHTSAPSQGAIATPVNTTSLKSQLHRFRELIDSEPQTYNDLNFNIIFTYFTLSIMKESLKENVLGKLNDSQVTKGKVQGAVKEVNRESCSFELVCCTITANDSASVIKLLVRMLKVCFVG